MTIDSVDSSRFRWVSTRDLMQEGLPAYQKRVAELLNGR
jgi:hypothetical protein